MPEGANHRFSWRNGSDRGPRPTRGPRLYAFRAFAVSRSAVENFLDNDDLLRASMFVKEVNWISIAAPAQPIRAEVKIRNKHAAARAEIIPTTDPSRVEVRFEEPQRAVTPGQGAVFYQGELVLGGADQGSAGLRR